MDIGEAGTWKGRLTAVVVKEGADWTKYGLKCPDAPVFATFSSTVADKAKCLIGEPVCIEWKKNERNPQYYDCLDVYPDDQAT